MSVAGRPAAAIVYRLRAHEINLFVTRVGLGRVPAGDAVEATRLRHGRVGRGRLAFAAVSDVDLQELTRFAELLRSPAP